MFELSERGPRERSTSHPLNFHYPLLSCYFLVVLPNVQYDSVAIEAVADLNLCAYYRPASLPDTNDASPSNRWKIGELRFDYLRSDLPSVIKNNQAVGSTTNS